MSRLLTVLTLLSVFLLVGGCDGSTKHSSTTSSAGTSAGTIQSSTTSQTSTSTTSADTETHSPPNTTASTATAGARNVRAPAAFTISGGRLTPTLVSTPAFVAIQVTIDSADGRQHQVVIRTPKPVTLTVPARGRATTMVGGLRAGTYVILVDGVQGGALITGGEPGP